MTGGIAVWRGGERPGVRTMICKLFIINYINESVGVPYCTKMGCFEGWEKCIHIESRITTLASISRGGVNPQMGCRSRLFMMG
jgi:hypothetical protein